MQQSLDPHMFIGDKTSKEQSQRHKISRLKTIPQAGLPTYTLWYKFTCQNWACKDFLYGWHTSPFYSFPLLQIFNFFFLLFFRLMKILLKKTSREEKLVVLAMDVSMNFSLSFFFLACWGYYTVNNQDGCSLYFCYTTPSCNCTHPLGSLVVSSFSNWNRVLQQK